LFVVDLDNVALAQSDGGTMRYRLLAMSVAVGLLAVACSNSTSSKTASVPTTKPGTPPITEASGAALRKNVSLSGVQGVTDSEIDVAVITAGSNPLAGDYSKFTDGIQAYFDMINADGGIYGRKLKISANRNDSFVNNQQTVKESLAQDHAFATFVATALFYGAGNLAAAKPPMPTFTWNINQEFAGKPNLFGNAGAICFKCAIQVWPFVAQEAHFARVAVLAYGGIAASQSCAAGVKASFEKFPSAKMAYVDPNLAIGQVDVSAQVSQMKAKQVQLVFTCVDQRETLIVAKEMAKQHLDAVQYVNNVYDPQFIKDNADLLEGDFVAPQFAVLENTPTIPVEQDFVKWMGKSGKAVSEVPGYGWIAALQFVHGLKLAGPNFSQQKVIDSLNQDTHFDADGMITPIDWTKQHNDPAGPKGTINEFAGDYQCVSLTRVHDGKFVPTFQEPGKPFTCMVGDRKTNTLTKTPTHQNFADSTG
jgi:branched-chain amino acid transport system substrate-binding protein